MRLMIVESPHKAQTIKNFLDEDFIVIATKGHVKELVKNSMGIIHVDGVYSAKWTVQKSSKHVLDTIKKYSQTAKEIFIATDDDREGERIGWDVVETLKIKQYYRITFNEITKKAVLTAIENKKEINQNVVNSQMARRIIDRIIGYPVSNMVSWYFKKHNIVDEKLLKGFGIGRVLAPALGILVRNKELIDNFIPKEYKKIKIEYFEEDMQFFVKNDKIYSAEKGEDNQEAEMEEVIKYLKNYMKNKHVVANFFRKIDNSAPPPPLTTSWMQRGANYQLGFRPEKTMKLAQELYEGIEVNGERKGLITYTRTDSNRISEELIFDMAQTVTDKYGEEYRHEDKRTYKNKSSAQEAHEAIRPISFTPEYEPEALAEFLSKDQFLLYEYIYNRTLAIQMKDSLRDKSILEVRVGNHKFKAYANELRFDGWEKIGEKWRDELEENANKVYIPETLHVNKVLTPINIVSYDYSEKKPQRYGIGRFITTLEDCSIARPSTIGTVTPRLEKKQLIKVENNIQIPTEFGIKVYHFLEEHAEWLLDLDHAKKFEESLDLIEKGEMNKDDLIEEYEFLKDEFKKKIGYESNEYEEKEKREVIGKCPVCKKSVYEAEKLFFCSTTSCDFKIWKNSLSKFFERFNKYCDEEETLSCVKIMLKNGKCFVTDLYSANKEKHFDAYISPEYSEKYNNWGIKLTYPKNKDVDPKYKVSVLAKRREENVIIEEEEGGKTTEKQIVNSDNVTDTSAVNENKAKTKESTQRGYEPPSSLRVKGVNAQAQEKDEKKENEESQDEKLTRLENEKRWLIDAIKKDHLTRAFNRKCFDKDMENFYAKGEDDLVVAFVDGDKFKNVNDTYGHQAGDEVLKSIVNTMFKASREHGRSRVYRYGGEEFIFLFVDTNRINVLNTLEKTRKDIESSSVEFEGREIKYTISIGVSFKEENESSASLIERADQAVYKAKEDGRNRIVIS